MQNLNENFLLGIHLGRNDKFQGKYFIKEEMYSEI